MAALSFVVRSKKAKEYECAWRTIKSGMHIGTQGGRTLLLGDQLGSHLCFHLCDLGRHAHISELQVSPC